MIKSDKQKIPHTILVVDDEPFQRQTLIEIFEEQGYRVFSATTGEKAIDIATTVNPDVVLMDYSLPGIDGVQTYRRMRKQNQDIQVILMSALSTKAFERAALNEGIRAFCSKPIEPDEMQELIAQLII